jgi:hypothetical protein
MFGKKKFVFMQIMRQPSLKAVPHAFFPAFVQCFFVQSRNLAWEKPEHNQTAPIPALIPRSREFR